MIKVGYLSMNESIDIILEMIRKEYAISPPIWKKQHSWSSVPVARRHWIEKECEEDSEFDTLRLRKRMIGLAARRNTEVTYATCMYGEIIAIYEGQQSEEDIPWELWGRILRLHSASRSKPTPYTIYFLASESRRLFPDTVRESIRPHNINGGYTYPCQHHSIVIYRAEDATRVLLHELQHASCLDHHEEGIDQVEAQTEAWAEILYTALLTRGSLRGWSTQWARQWNWILQQNQRVKRHMKSALSTEFPWRYTLGKEKIFREWFHSLPPTFRQVSVENSLRLTVPPTLEQKRSHGIRPQSIIL